MFVVGDREEPHPRWVGRSTSPPSAVIRADTNAATHEVTTRPPQLDPPSLTRNHHGNRNQRMPSAAEATTRANRNRTTSRNPSPANNHPNRSATSSAQRSQPPLQQTSFTRHVNHLTQQPPAASYEAAQPTWPHPCTHTTQPTHSLRGTQHQPLWVGPRTGGPPTPSPQRRHQRRAQRAAGQPANAPTTADIYQPHHHPRVTISSKSNKQPQNTAEDTNRRQHTPPARPPPSAHAVRRVVCVRGGGVGGRRACGGV